MAAARLLRLAALDPQHTTTRTRPCSPVRARLCSPVRVAKAGLDLAGRAPRLAWTRRDGESRGVRSVRRWWWSRGSPESELEQKERRRRVGIFKRVCAGRAEARREMEGSALDAPLLGAR